MRSWPCSRPIATTHRYGKRLRKRSLSARNTSFTCLPLDAAGVRLVETWRTLGMRGTGSHDLVLDRVFVPETAIDVRRPSGVWHPQVHLEFMLVLPLIYAVYLGLAEAGRALALQDASRKRDDANLQSLVGEMDSALLTAQLAHQHMIDTAAGSEPGPQTTNHMLIARTLAGRAAIRTLETAMEVVGGASFYRDRGLERLYRDVQAARFHPRQEKPQIRYTGRLALGLDVNP